METHRPPLINTCVMDRAVTLAFPAEAKATMRSRFRDPRVDLSLQVLYTGVMAELGVGYRTESILRNLETEILGNGMNVISPVHSELHCPSVSRAASGALRKETVDDFRALLNKVAKKKPCFVNIQGYSKLEDDPIYHEVLDYFQRTLPLPSPVELH
jgi:hypothetical protein